MTPEEEFHREINALFSIQGLEYSPPVVEGCAVDMYHLYEAVKTRGGYGHVTREHLWSEVARSLPPPSSTLSHILISRLYLTYCLLLEPAYRRSRRRRQVFCPPSPPTPSEDHAPSLYALFSPLTPATISQVGQKRSRLDLSKVDETSERVEGMTRGRVRAGPALEARHVMPDHARWALRTILAALGDDGPDPRAMLIGDNSIVNSLFEILGNFWKSRSERKKSDRESETTLVLEDVECVSMIHEEEEKEPVEFAVGASFVLRRLAEKAPQAYETVVSNDVGTHSSVLSRVMSLPSVDRDLRLNCADVFSFYATHWDLQPEVISNAASSISDLVKCEEELTAETDRWAVGAAVFGLSGALVARLHNGHEWMSQGEDAQGVCCFIVDCFVNLHLRLQSVKSKDAYVFLEGLFFDALNVLFMLSTVESQYWQDQLALQMPAFLERRERHDLEFIRRSALWSGIRSRCRLMCDILIQQLRAHSSPRDSFSDRGRTAGGQIAQERTRHCARVLVHISDCVKREAEAILMSVREKNDESYGELIDDNVFLLAGGGVLSALCDLSVRVPEKSIADVLASAVGNLVTSERVVKTINSLTTS